MKQSQKLWIKLFPKALGTLKKKNHIKDILRENEFFSYFIPIYEQLLQLSIEINI